MILFVCLFVDWAAIKKGFMAMVDYVKNNVGNISKINKKIQR